MTTKLHSADIQTMVHDWAVADGGFDAPYGILTGEHTNAKGKKYKSVTFGYTRTMDATVEIYNSNFILFKCSRMFNPRVFKSADDLMAYLTNKEFV